MPGVTQQQLDGLGSRFDKGFDEIKSLMRSFDERIRIIETREAGCYPALDARIAQTERDLAENKKEINELRTLVQTQATTAEKLSNVVNTINGWGKWIAGIATALITAGVLFFIGRLIYLAIMRDIP